MLKYKNKERIITFCFINTNIYMKKTINMEYKVHNLIIMSVFRIMYSGATSLECERNSVGF